MTRDYGQFCPIANSLDIIGDRWTMLILRDLFLGDSRFSEFRQHSPGMPTKILSDRLKSLEHDGVIERHIYNEHPLRAKYRLTAHARSIAPIIAAIYDWGMHHTLTPVERRIIRRRIAARTTSR